MKGLKFSIFFGNRCGRFCEKELLLRRRRRHWTSTFNVCRMSGRNDGILECCQQVQHDIVSVASQAARLITGVVDQLIVAMG